SRPAPRGPGRAGPGCAPGSRPAAPGPDTTARTAAPAWYAAPAQAPTAACASGRAPRHQLRRRHAIAAGALGLVERPVGRPHQLVQPLLVERFGPGLVDGSHAQAGADGHARAV